MYSPRMRIGAPRLLRFPGAATRAWNSEREQRRLRRSQSCDRRLATFGSCHPRGSSGRVPWLDLGRGQSVIHRRHCRGVARLGCRTHAGKPAIPAHNTQALKPAEHHRPVEDAAGRFLPSVARVGVHRPVAHKSLGSILGRIAFRACGCRPTPGWTSAVVLRLPNTSQARELLPKNRNAKAL